VDQSAITKDGAREARTVTQRYMHLSPAALYNAIRLLESPGIPPGRGDGVETRGNENEKTAS
jgi:hypothetical protein